MKPFDQRPEAGGGAGHVDTWEQSSLGRGTKSAQPLLQVHPLLASRPVPILPLSSH